MGTRREKDAVFEAIALMGKAFSPRAATAQLVPLLVPPRRQEHVGGRDVRRNGALRAHASGNRQQHDRNERQGCSTANVHGSTRRRLASGKQDTRLAAKVTAVSVVTAGTRPRGRVLPA